MYMSGFLTRISSLPAISDHLGGPDELQPYLTLLAAIALMQRSIIFQAIDMNMMFKTMHNYDFMKKTMLRFSSSRSG